MTLILVLLTSLDLTVTTQRSHVLTWFLKFSSIFHISPNVFLTSFHYKSFKSMCICHVQHALCNGSLEFFEC